MVVERTAGTKIFTADGDELIDAMSSWWAACLGHGHPALRAAAHRQIDTMSHVMFGGLTHEPAVLLAEKLIQLTDEPLQHVFFSDSGSVAMEVALKMVFQYQRGIGHPERRRMLTWRRGYHGDTFATMSLCDPQQGMHAMWSGQVTEHVFAPMPPPRGSSAQVIADYVRELDALIDDTVAGIVVEPIVQGAGGMRFHDDVLIRELRSLADAHGILLVADEIATGFGRTGAWFATSAAGVTPDVLAVGKALTGGFMSLAATLTTPAVAAAISSDEGGGALMHGPTFMGNPLACSVALAAVETLESMDVASKVRRIELELQEGLAALRGLRGVEDVRVLGAIGVVELAAPVDMARATRVSVAHGVWLRPFGKLVYTMPPFVSSTEEVQAICHAMCAVVEAELAGQSG